MTDQGGEPEVQKSQSLYRSTYADCQIFFTHCILGLFFVDLFVLGSFVHELSNGEVVSILCIG